eukprot:gnl/Spiro4/7282_TR3808_c0_g1_i1.p1 gnl/Spiro4/7282_TR3808_c0_g1~~gnl/Spiro4/7282_TR3808_c0_g1_i1.p1  ORF type:complete len:415 (+),score=48.95 gnl/Spiro4/7282_TR3808_c0_g1_i1:84-1328(+)
MDPSSPAPSTQPPPPSFTTQPPPPSTTQPPPPPSQMSVTGSQIVPPGGTGAGAAGLTPSPSLAPTASQEFVIAGPRRTFGKASVAGKPRKKITPKALIGEIGSEVFSVRFSPDGALVAAGCSDGGVRLYNTETGRLSYHLNVGLVNGLPMTCLRFRPHQPGKQNRNVLLTANANGAVQHWHVFSGKNIHTVQEDDGQQVYAVDYNREGTQFASCGRDYAVRVYDEATKTCVVKMAGGPNHYPPGHSNRVFAVKFHPGSPQLLASGGWDNTIQIWDLRAAIPVRSIYGPHICGDSLDIANDTILTGSWTPRNQLQLWDFGTGNLIDNVPFQSGVITERCYLYAAQFSKRGNGDMIVAGGSGANECRVIDTQSKQVLGNVTGLLKGVYGVDFSQDDSKLAVGGAECSLRLYNITDQ